MTRISLKSNILNEVNKSFIKEMILEHGPVSKPDIAKLTRLSLPTVNKIVDELKAENYVRVHCVGRSTGGRRPNLYAVNDSSGYICIVFIQGRKISGQLCGLTGTTLNSDGLTTDTFDNMDVTKIVLDMIAGLLKGYNADNLKIIGVGVPGIVAKDGTITGIPTIPQLEGANLKKEIRKIYSAPVVVENDVNMSALGISGEDEKYSDIVYVYIGKGVGMGIVFNGQLYRGASRLAGEVGKMVSVKYEKNKDMLTDEMLVIFNKIFPEGTSYDPLRLAGVFEDSAGLEAEISRLRQLSTFLIINTFCFLDPNVIFLDGDLVCEPLIKCIKDGLIDYFGQSYAEKVVFRPGAETGISGAKQYCLSKVNKNPILFMRREEI